MSTSVYLLHFDRAFKHARHYIGVATADALAVGTYAPAVKLLAAARQAGVGWTIADVWEGLTVGEAYALARRLKRQGGHARKCSICRPGNQAGVGRGNYERRIHA